MKTHQTVSQWDSMSTFAFMLAAFVFAAPPLCLWRYLLFSQPVLAWASLLLAALPLCVYAGWHFKTQAETRKDPLNR